MLVAPVFPMNDFSFMGGETPMTFVKGLPMFVCILSACIVVYCVQAWSPMKEACVTPKSHHRSSFRPAPSPLMPSVSRGVVTMHAAMHAA